MKCIRYLDNRVARVPEDVAAHDVHEGLAIYIPKSTWKTATRKQTENQVKRQVRKDQKKKSLRG